MIKKTVYFGNPSYLSVKLGQLVIDIKDGNNVRSMPIEDIGIVILDHPQITISHEVIRRLMDNDAVLISCNGSHMPASYMLPIAGHHLTTRHQIDQLESSIPLRKQLWQQTIEAKVANQAAVLLAKGKDAKRLEVLQTRVSSGDHQNIEGQAAAYYWSALFGKDFVREQEGSAPNSLLNYGYAILRGIVARALVSSGLHLPIGIHHHNQYNPYCLADDIMEPFRPIVDTLVYDMVYGEEMAYFLDTHTKQKLLSIPTIDVRYERKTSPLMVGIVETTASLVECYQGKRRKIKYPQLII